MVLHLGHSSYSSITTTFILVRRNSQVRSKTPNTFRDLRCPTVFLSFVSEVLIHWSIMDFTVIHLLIYSCWPGYQVGLLLDSFHQALLEYVKDSKLLEDSSSFCWLCCVSRTSHRVSFVSRLRFCPVVVGSLPCWLRTDTSRTPEIKL